MANLLKGVENEKERECLSKAEEKYKYQDMFFDIMEWTDLKKNGSIFAGGISKFVRKTA